MHVVMQFDEAHEIIARHDTLKHTREVKTSSNFVWEGLDV